MKIWETLFNLDSDREVSLKGAAALLNQHFAVEDTHFIKNQLSEFKLFKKGTRKTIQNVITESHLDYERHFFDYRYTISNGKSSTRFKQSVLFFNSKNLELPSFYQQPETFIDRILAWMGYDDIDFSSHPTYSFQNKLTGEYESVIRHYFSSEVLDVLSNQPSFFMEGMNFYFILYTNRELLPTNRVKGFLELGQMLYQLFRLRNIEV